MTHNNSIKHNGQISNDMELAVDALAAIQAEPLSRLLRRARLLREEGHGVRISYSKKVFIPLTRLCRNVCGYCTFVRGPKDVDHPYLLPHEVLEIAKLGVAAGCHEALFTL